MKFQEIPANIHSFRVKRTNASNLPLTNQPVFSVETCLTRPGEFEIRLRDSILFVKPVMETDTRCLNTELASGREMLAQLANLAVDGSVELQVAFFPGKCLEMGDLEIGVDEYVERGYGDITRQELSGQKLHAALSGRCSYSHGGQSYFFLLAGPAMSPAMMLERAEEPKEDSDAQELESEEAVIPEGAEEESTHSLNEETPHRIKPTLANSFCVMGKDLRFVATEVSRPDGQTVFIISRLHASRSKPDRALRLAKGKLSFTDWTRAGQVQILTQAQLAELTQNDGSYLKQWDEFVSVEGELLLAKARMVGILEYVDMTPNRNGTVTVRITQASSAAWDALAEREVESVQCVDKLPEYLKNPELTFDEFIVLEEVPGKQLKVIDHDAAGKSLTLKTENLPESGKLILSLVGELVQIKRRKSARETIIEGRAANPQLGLLIEERGLLAPTRPASRIKPLTAFVRDKVFRNPPTEKQREAIEVALNTPDIALIQGPPGTGKTTIIAAIIERLNELADKRGSSFKGSVLLTGFQHDAVENMIERLSLNGIPVPKFGKRSGDDEEIIDMFEWKLDEWCSERAAELRLKNPTLAQAGKESEIRNLSLQYLKAPTRKLAAILAERIADLGLSTLGEECTYRAARIAKKLSMEEKLNSKSDPMLEFVRRVRHRPETFADDGPDRAADVLDDLKEILERDERDLLENASLWRVEMGNPPFLKDLEALKLKLLHRLTAPPVFRIEKVNDEVVALVEAALKKIRSVGISAKDAKTAALAEFLDELECNPSGLVKAVSDYAYAFAATCQQSVNKLMQEKKGISELTASKDIQKFEYEFVVVDEAARVTPPDLMIAMAQGKRIILVGDHRQLPHIIDEAVAREMESEQVGKSESAWLKQSMFQYLFSDRLKTLEQKDGIVRRVTLDVQYRMHPLLGEFVSRNFYERFDPSEKFNSGRAESDFKHGLPGTEGKPAVWLDVPVSKGMHSKTGTSWTRQAEATAIAQLLTEWMTSPEGKELTFGVISFYKAQAELIQKKLRAVSNDPKKLRIGTVDSFQGMEFDVVILSMVRTLSGSWKPRSEDPEIQARGLFGHLCLYNRLNVSMSRQKRLLVVVGDSGLVNYKLAVKYVPGLVDFYKLCLSEGAVLSCR